MKILIIEDDETLCQSLKMQIQQQGYRVSCCNDGQSGYFAVLSGNPDVILLDRMLPDMDGVQVLSMLRKQQILTPVLLLTALGDIEDRVVGLDSGADDYLVKPFAFDELMARIRMLLRRHDSVLDTAITRGNTTFYTDTGALKTGAQELQLTKKEAELLATLLNMFGNTVSRPELIKRTWGENAEITDSNLDNYISFLRRHLALLGSSLVISTVRGIGFKLTANEEDTDDA